MHRVHGTLVRHRVLGAFREWLDPLDRQKMILPPVNIRTSLLQLLLEFPVQGEVIPPDEFGDFEGISTEDVKTSEIGPVIALLMRHPLETIENRRLAEKLIEKWAVLTKYPDGIVPPPEERETFSVRLRLREEDDELIDQVAQKRRHSSIRDTFAAWYQDKVKKGEIRPGTYAPVPERARFDYAKFPAFATPPSSSSLATVVKGSAATAAVTAAAAADDTEPVRKKGRRAAAPSAAEAFVSPASTATERMMATYRKKMINSLRRRTHR